MTGAKQRLAAAAGALLTLAMVAGLARELARGGLDALGGAMPSSPAFVASVVALYLVPPLADLFIFRRLWRVPLAAGLAACVRKRIANEVVLGYSGEAYFYAWARARGLAGAPFEAVKDVGILSALAGNLATLAGVAGALAVGAGSPRLLLGSAAVLVAMTAPFLLWRRRVFSLGRATLWWVFAVHLARIAATTLLIAVAWSVALPGVAAATWALLAAGRLLVSRLPLVPNKELLFANFAIVWLGGATGLSAVIAVVAALTLALHLACVAAIGAGWLVSRARR